MNKKVIVQNLPKMSYKEAWSYQESLFDPIVKQKIANKNDQTDIPTNNYLVLCEHQDVYTIGKSGKIENLLLSEAELAAKNIEFHKINRGGDITYHGAGQLVGYPILDLDNFKPDIHRYMRDLEEVIILTIADFGLSGGRIEGLTGVWLDYQEGAKNPRKICAAGVKASRWVTMHGFALNINTDLSFFQNIIPCGITDKAVTSMKHELGKDIPLKEVQKSLIKHFEEVFDAKCEE